MSDSTKKTDKDKLKEAHVRASKNHNPKTPISDQFGLNDKK